MPGLKLKYFVLNPRAKTFDDLYAHASREALQAYAEAIEQTDPDLAQTLRIWRNQEIVRIYDPIKED